MAKVQSERAKETLEHFSSAKNFYSGKNLVELSLKSKKGNLRSYLFISVIRELTVQFLLKGTSQTSNLIKPLVKIVIQRPKKNFYNRLIDSIVNLKNYLGYIFAT